MSLSADTQEDMPYLVGPPALERLALALLQIEMPIPKPVRLLGISLSALQQVDDAEPQLVLPM